jgi:hypothetical protein
MPSHELMSIGASHRTRSRYVHRLILLLEPHSEDWVRYVHRLIPVQNKSSDLSGTIDLTGQRLCLRDGVGKEQLVSCARLR